MAMVVFIVSLCFAMAIGIPIAFSLLFSGVAMMVHLDVFNTQILAQNLISGADSFAMMAVPFFMLAGDLMNSGGLTKRIVKFALVAVGHIRGGLGYVAILAIIMFASLVGSAVASTAALGAILIPMMVKAGYDRDRSTALIASGNLLAPIIPPSVPMIFFGVTAGVSISKLFMSGIVPGIIIAIALAITWGIVSRKDKAQVLPKSSLKELFKAAIDAIWALMMPLIIIIGMRGGIFTPTEAGVVAVVYSLFVGFFVYRELTLEALYKSLVSSAKTTSVVMFLAAAAMVSAWLMAIGNIPGLVSDILQPFIGNKILLMLVINLIVVLVGTAMDVNPTILILTPVLMPIVKQAGIDPVYFGLVFVINNVIGLLTPPVGTVLNVACGAGKISMERLIKAIMPFFIVECAILLLFILFPQIVTIPLKFLTQ
ncbi:TRAP transporter large permease subunit [Clostridium sp.]|uniref:TRAP transporter large permease n=1 Tax=Clostridium sp. TaxID=1506 RepID=UPI002FC94476